VSEVVRVNLEKVKMIELLQSVLNEAGLQPSASTAATARLQPRVVATRSGYITDLDIGVLLNQASGVIDGVADIDLFQRTRPGLPLLRSAAEGDQAAVAEEFLVIASVGRTGPRPQEIRLLQHLHNETLTAVRDRSISTLQRHLELYENAIEEYLELTSAASSITEGSLDYMDMVRSTCRNLLLLHRECLEADFPEAAESVAWLSSALMNNAWILRLLGSPRSS
jgi:hypothetical protein